MKIEPIRTAVLVSGGGTNLQAILNAADAGVLPSAKIELVISNVEGAFALERAHRAGIPALTVTRKACGSREAFEEAILRELEKNKIEVIVLAGFLAILSDNFVSRYPKRILNVHPSLIPAFCGQGFYGLKVHEAALERGVKVTGATVHFVNEIPDGGEIILQKSVPVRENDTPQTLQKRVMRQAEWKLLPAALERVASQLIEEKIKENRI